jgi:hypothetical protein
MEQNMAKAHNAMLRPAGRRESTPFSIREFLANIRNAWIMDELEWWQGPVDVEQLKKVR